MWHTEATFPGMDGTELYCQSWHPASHPRAAVVGVHGHGDHSGGLHHIVEHLVAGGYAWYGLDLRGHGRSPGIRGHVPHWSDFQDDMQAFLHWVKKQDAELPVFLLGHSLGGLISLDYAIRSPKGLKGVVAISPPLQFTGFSPIMIKLIRALAYLRPEMTIRERPDYSKLTRDPEVVRRLAADPLRHGLMTAGLGREIIGAQRWVNAHAPDLQLPLLMLYGLSDRITPGEGSRQFFDAVPTGHKEQHEYPQTPHRPFDDLNRAEVLGHLSAWLDRQTDAAGLAV